MSMLIPMPLLHRVSMSFTRDSCRLSAAMFLASRQIAHAASSSLDGTPDGHKSQASVPSLIVFDAPSKPSDHRTRRSARSPHSLIDYYNFHRHVPRGAPSQVRSTTSTSASSFADPPLNSVPHPTNPHSRTFDKPSRPRKYYVRPQRKRDLPEVTSKLPVIVLLTALGLSAWAAFLLYATNMERLSSSVVRQLCSNLKAMASVKEVLGDGVKPEGKWWLGGEPWIDGAINLLQGHVDVSFRVKGSKGVGTLYFTSVREDKGRPFTILRSKLICDNGVVLQLTDY